MTDRDRRALVVGGVVVAAAWLALRGLPTVVTFVIRTEAQVEQHRLLINRARARLARLDQFADSIQKLEVAADALPSTLLVGGDPQTAQVDLMQRMRALLATQPVQVEEFRAGPGASQNSELALAHLTARVETDFRTLIRVLVGIEDDAALGLESVEVEAADPHAGPDQPEELRATLGISGWFHPEAAKVADSAVSFTR